MCITNLKGPAGQSFNGHDHVHIHHRGFRGRTSRRAYGAFPSELSESSRSMLDTGQAASSLPSSTASSSPYSSELVPSSLEELSDLAAAYVSGLK
jgi:hypothetical protein